MRGQKGGDSRFVRPAADRKCIDTAHRLRSFHSTTTTVAPTIGLAPSIPLRPEPGRDHVVLSPVCPAGGVRPAGYLTRIERTPDDPRAELRSIRWTLQALEVLAPDAFLLAYASASALTDPGLEEELGHALGDRFMPALEVTRMGRRRKEAEEALTRLRHLGLRVALWGQRVCAPGDFDSLVVDPRTAGSFLDPQGKPLIVTGIASSRDAHWATEQGATMVEGPAVGEPIKVAPVDLTRLRR